MIIRTVKPKDFKDIISIYDYTYEEVKDNPNFGDIIRSKRPSKKYYQKWASNIYKEVQNGNVIYIVAEHNGKIIGSCFVRKRDTPNSELSHVGVLQIRVAKEWRGKGIGKKLLQNIIKKCRGKFEIIDLFVVRTNDYARNLYREVGFKTWGIAPGFIKRKNKYIDMEYMYLNLNK